MVAWRYGIIISLLLFFVLTCEILSWSLKEKFHISRSPCIILYVDLLLFLKINVLYTLFLQSAQQPPSQ